MHTDLYPSEFKGKKEGIFEKKMDKKAIGKIIKDLIRRRQQHQLRINKLLDPNYHHQDITKTSQTQQYNEFSEMLRKLQVQQPQVLQDSIGSLGNHVNLLATVSLKTQYYLAEKQQVKEYGQLYQSLLNHYGNKRIIEYELSEQKPKETQAWMEQLVHYLLKEDLANGLFVTSQGEKGALDLYGTYFMRGKYSQILLSKEEIEQEQMKLIYTSQQSPQVINISWLLLWRLLHQQRKDLNLPLAIHRLFSFPYKQYQIGKSLELIEMNQLLYSLEQEAQANQQQRSTLKFYGAQKTGKMAQIKNISKQKMLTSYISLIHQYESVLIMNEIQFPVKSIPLSCLKHHFVVVTLIIKQKGHYYINVGGIKHRQRFKICLLDFEGNLVQYEIVNSGQFMLSQLRQEQYELYISPQGVSQQKEEDESFELVKEKQQQFSLWVQGRGVCSKQGDLQLQIRLKQQYNSYTIYIAKKYIEQHSIRESVIAQKDIIVERYLLRVMDLVVDTFVSPFKDKLSVKYQGQALCDQFFQDNKIFIKPNDSIALREETQIEQITNVNNQKLTYQIVYIFL